MVPGRTRRERTFGALAVAGVCAGLLAAQPAGAAAPGSLASGALFGSAFPEVASGSSTANRLPAAYDGPGALVEALSSGEARPGALAQTDLDADGAPDLIAGYSWGGGGIVTVQGGNPDAFAPQDPAVLQRMQQGAHPSWVAGDARAVRVPDPVSYVQAGDFNGDDSPDALVAAQDGGMYLLAGDGKGGLGPARRVALPGPVTTFATGEFGAADGDPEVAVGVAGPTGPQLLVYDGARGKVAKPRRLALPGNAIAIALGALDSDPYADIAIATGGGLEILHGWGRGRSAPSSRVEGVAGVSGARGIAIGNFLRDSDGRNEIAVTFAGGTVRLLIPDGLDTGPPTGEISGLGAAVRAAGTRVRPRDVKSQPAWSPSTAADWHLGRRIARDAGGVAAQHLVTTAKLSPLDTDDLLVATATHGLRLVRASAAPGSSLAATNEFRTAVDFPAAVVAMPQAANGDRGAVVAGAEGDQMVLKLAGPTITVDRTDDTAAASACTGAANDCSLRGAVAFANVVANAGTTINLPAGTYVLNINGNGGCLGGGESNSIGDLEVNQSTDIVGAGAATTIIRQTGTGDRVMCLNALFTIGLQYTFSGVTITGGRETHNIGGGGIIGGELDNSLTLNSVVVSNNQATTTGLGGGGIQITGGSLTINNSTIGGTSAPGADRTNVNLANSTTISGGGLTYTPSSPKHEDGTGVLTITDSTISRNTAGGIGGGGADLLIFAFADPGGIGSGSADITNSTFTNNQATGTGGGIVVESLTDVDIASTSFTNNSAGNRGGGVYLGGGDVFLDGTTSPGVTFSGNTATTAGSTISTAAPVAVSGSNVTLAGDIEISPGGSWTNNSGSTISPTNVVIAGGTFNANNSTTNMAGNLTFSSGTFNSGTGIFNFNGSGAQSITGPGSPTFNTLQVNKTGGSTLTLGVNSPVKSDLTVNTGTLDLGAFTADRTVAGGMLTVANGSTLKIGGTGDLPANYNTNALGTTSTVEYNGSGAQTITGVNYGNLTSSSSGGRTLPNGGTAGVAGTFTPGTNAYTVTGSTVNFNGAGAQTIPAFAYNNLTSSSSGARTLANAGTVGVAGTFTPGTNAYTVTGSTVNFNGAGAQTIPAFAYNNLTSSSSGARTLANAGTVGVAGTFTPGTNAYTVTGSTVNFNGAGAQTIPAFAYNNLTSSSSGARTLANAGTVGVAGTFTPGTNAYTVTGSTVNFNGAGAQTIPAFAYNNLTSSSSGARTLANSGTVGVAGAFTPGANSYTTTGSTVSFNGTGAQSIPGFAFNNLTDANTAALVTLLTASTVNGALTVNAGAVLNTATNLLTLNGGYTNNGQIRHNQTQSLNAMAGPFSYVDGRGLETARLSNLSAVFGTTVTNSAAGGTNPFNNGCGALPAGAVKRFWQVTPTTGGTGTARFSFRDDELPPGVMPNHLAIYRCPAAGGSWTQELGAYTRPTPAGPAPGYSSVEVSGVTFNSAGVTYVGALDPTVDSVPPIVSIEQAAGQADPTSDATIHFKATFGEPVFGFTDDDVLLGGTAGATTALVTQIAPEDGTTYDVAVSGMTVAGTVTPSIPAGAATDGAGNPNTASNSDDNTVDWAPAGGGGGGGGDGGDGGDGGGGDGGGGDGGGGDGGGGGAGAGADTTPPSGTLAGKGSQDVDKLALTVGSNETATASGQASVSVPGGKKPVTSKAATASIPASGTAQLKFKFKKSSLKKIKKAISKGKRPKAKITVTVTDGAANKTTLSKSVKLKD